MGVKHPRWARRGRGASGRENKHLSEGRDRGGLCPPACPAVGPPPNHRLGGSEPPAGRPRCPGFSARGKGPRTPASPFTHAGCRLLLKTTRLPPSPHASPLKAPTYVELGASLSSSVTETEASAGIGRTPYPPKRSPWPAQIDPSMADLPNTAGRECAPSASPAGSLTRRGRAPWPPVRHPGAGTASVQPGTSAGKPRGWETPEQPEQPHTLCLPGENSVIPLRVCLCSVCICHLSLVPSWH